MKCHIIEFDAVDWSVLDRFADRTVFQTREWIEFIRQSQNAMPVIAELREGREVAGYFTGLTFTRLGIKILGSSFPGWTTPYIGFNVRPGASRATALAAVEEMAWSDLKCLHMEVSDPCFAIEDAPPGFAREFYISYRTDLTKSEEELFEGMDSACRRCIRKAEKSGVTIEEAHDLAFADEYYQQLIDVFAKQRLVPTYTVDRVRALRPLTQKPLVAIGGITRELAPKVFQAGADSVAVIGDLFPDVSARAKEWIAISADARDAAK